MDEENLIEILNCDSPTADVIRIKPLPSVDRIKVTYHFDEEGRFVIDTIKRILLGHSQFANREDALANGKYQRILATTICDDILSPIFFWTAKRDSQYFVYGKRNISVYSSQLRFWLATALAETCDDEYIVSSLIHLLREIYAHLIGDFSRGLLAIPRTTDVVSKKKYFWKDTLSALVKQGMPKPYFEAVTLIFDCYINNYVVTMWNEEKYLGIQESL